MPLDNCKLLKNKVFFNTAINYVSLDPGKANKFHPYTWEHKI